jgi:DNA mismatch endonuclease (patch repair protein)
MTTQRRRDTAAELAVRRALHAAGLRYRVHYVALPGSRRTVDVAFPKARLAVHVDGCWWHGCPDHGHIPRTNAVWWVSKFEHNKRRDLDTDRRLRLAGWTSVRVWEHQTPEEVVSIVSSELRRLVDETRSTPAE